MEADKKAKYEAEILKAIKDHKIMRWEHCFSGILTFSRATAYNFELDKLDNIKEAIQENRRKGVQFLLQKWMTSGNATLQIAAMRMICDSDEHRLLNQQYTEHSGQPFNIIVRKGTKTDD